MNDDQIAAVKEVAEVSRLREKEEVVAGIGNEIEKAKSVLSDRGFDMDEINVIKRRDPFDWMKLWLESYEKANGDIDTNRIIEWILEQPMGC